MDAVEVATARSRELGQAAGATSVVEVAKKRSARKR
jgi:hypothetical protein